MADDKCDSHCAFCDVANGIEPEAIIYENSEVVVILDHRPVFKGHCLLIPRSHIRTLLDLPESLMGKFFTKLQQTATVVQQAMKAQGTFVAMNNTVSQSVPHLHVHVVPRSKGDGLKGFFWPRHKYEGNELAETASRLKATWQALYGN